jgi:hypothetical protein
VDSFADYKLLFCMGFLQGAAAPMFPFEDDENDYDDYGAVLHPGEFRQADGVASGMPFPSQAPFFQHLLVWMLQHSLCDKITCGGP